MTHPSGTVTFLFTDIEGSTKLVLDTATYGIQYARVNLSIGKMK